jgi:hypothetical protein
MLSLFTSIQKAIAAHSKNMARNPARKPKPILGCTSRAAKKATMAIDHQGRYRPAINESRKVNRVVRTNFI